MICRVDSDLNERIMVAMEFGTGFSKFGQYRRGTACRARIRQGKIPMMAYIITGTACRAPTVRIDDHNPMKMIRHHHEFIQIDIREMFRQGLPHRLHDASGCIQMHDPRLDVTETRQPPMRADGNEIRARLPVIESGHPVRPTVRQIIIQGHGGCRWGLAHHRHRPVRFPSVFSECAVGARHAVPASDRE